MLKIGHPAIGSDLIPRQDNFYDLVLMHHIPQVYFGLSKTPAVLKRIRLEGKLILRECLRVLRKGGELRTYPLITDVDWLERDRGVSEIRQESVEGVPPLQKEITAIFFASRWETTPNVIKKIYDNRFGIRK